MKTGEKLADPVQAILDRLNGDGFVDVDMRLENVSRIPPYIKRFDVEIDSVDVIGEGVRVFLGLSSGHGWPMVGDKMVDVSVDPAMEMGNVVMPLRVVGSMRREAAPGDYRARFYRSGVIELRNQYGERLSFPCIGVDFGAWSRTANPRVFTPSMDDHVVSSVLLCMADADIFIRTCGMSSL